MLKFYTVRFVLFFSLALALFSCKKETETFQTDSLEAYYPLEKGKYVTYRLDSTVYTNFGRTTEIRRYQEKHVTDAQITDNLGRPSYRIFRYLNDSTASGSWKPAGSYFVTIANNQVEVIENNLRFVKIRLPFKDGNSWKGNSFLPYEPYASLFNFNNDDNMDEWEYYFDGEKQTEKIGNKTVDDVYTIRAVDQSYNIPMPSDTVYASRTLSFEKYAKDIGLVYRELYMWESQPNATIITNPPYSPSNPLITYDPYKTGFGVKMWMIDHN